jgi:hypothetical protein
VLDNLSTHETPPSTAGSRATPYIPNPFVSPKTAKAILDSAAAATRARRRGPRSTADRSCHEQLAGGCVGKPIDGHLGLDRGNLGSLRQCLVGQPIFHGERRLFDHVCRSEHDGIGRE